MSPRLSRLPEVRAGQALAACTVLTLLPSVGFPKVLPFAQQQRYRRTPAAHPLAAVVVRVSSQGIESNRAIPAGIGESWLKRTQFL